MNQICYKKSLIIGSIVGVLILIGNILLKPNLRVDYAKYNDGYITLEVSNNGKYSTTIRSDVEITTKTLKSNESILSKTVQPMRGYYRGSTRRTKTKGLINIEQGHTLPIRVNLSARLFKITSLSIFCTNTRKNIYLNKKDLIQINNIISKEIYDEALKQWKEEYDEFLVQKEKIYGLKKATKDFIDEAKAEHDFHKLHPRPKELK